MVTCRVGTNVIVCGPPGVYRRAILDCPACDRRHRFVISWDGAWYGQTYYGSCGDKWQDGEMYPRPFQRGWRQKAQADFRRRWDYAASRPLFERYVTADRGTALARSDRQAIKAFRKRAVAAELIRRERAS